MTSIAANASVSPVESAEVADPKPPGEGTLERWAWRLILVETLGEKLSLRPPPRVLESTPVPRRIPKPGRPCSPARAPRLRTSEASLCDPQRRRDLLLAFLHHEVQAAELFAWAILAFAAAPKAFRLGLSALAADELRHARMYQNHIETLGGPMADEWVRKDWFWERVPQSRSPAEFVATLGIGFEGGNLDHAAKFAARFERAGDREGARVLEQIGREEIRHVAFAAQWFRTFTGGLEFDDWRDHLPAPLSPMVMRGAVVNREARRQAGLPEAFLECLDPLRAASDAASDRDGAGVSRRTSGGGH